MKKKNSYKTLKKKKHVKTVPRLIGSKLGMLLGIIVPIAIILAYSMNQNFFSITRILSIFILIISMAAYLKEEIIYSHPKVVHRGNMVIKKKDFFSLNKGTVQVVLSILIIIVLTYLVQAVYKTIG